MLYQGDAHHYRSIIKKKQRAQRMRGLFLIALSVALMFYAIPCFAASVFDYDDQLFSGTVFSDAISDHANTTESATTELAVSGESANLAANSNLMSETVGPAMLANDTAVDSAKKRAEAMKVVTSTQSTMVTAKAAPQQTVEKPTINVFPAIVAFVLSMVCAILGIRMITHSRQMLGRRITAEYCSALRAC
ncbi:MULTISPECIES: hypothetical protein [unclassified Adlercreutzia]|uniref:hypothetical protein n=1 Tax=unclassified Adlercreutzia TaxID=2636013 RepID=UPI0013EDCC7E|nr:MULTISPECIES: hypothetical protein [unclassified Adlercreutzia]